MNNTDLLLIVGIGLIAAGLAHLLPFTAGGQVTHASRPVWLPVLLGAVAAVAGAVTVLVIAFR